MKSICYLTAGLNLTLGLVCHSNLTPVNIGVGLALLAVALVWSLADYIRNRE
jgi:hypothetical protein